MLCHASACSTWAPALRGEGTPAQPRQELAQLVESTKEEQIRGVLLRAGAPAHLGKLLPAVCLLWRHQGGCGSWPSQATVQLLNLLRVLRNLCAAGSDAGALLACCSIPEQVAALVLEAAPRAGQQGVQRDGVRPAVHVSAFCMAVACL